MDQQLEISSYLNQVYEDWQNSRGAFPKNVYLSDYWPIPFFGNPATAVVATIGVNPSSGEFRCGRGWSKVKEVAGWKERLLKYFDHSTPSHEWFEAWRTGLEVLGISYEAGTAAHFDISYRPTKAMLKNKSTDSEEFSRMATRDVKWLFRLLTLSPKLKLLLTFGPILRASGSTDPLVGFLRRRAHEHGFKVLSDGGLQHVVIKREFTLHQADTPQEKCVTCRVVKNLYANQEVLRARIRGI